MVLFHSTNYRKGKKMAKALSGLEPAKVWEYFEEICNHPHPSKKEEKLSAYILDWARKHNFETQKDKLGNIVIRKKATIGMENRKGVCIQGHIDMVCEKNADVEFDFDKDPIQPYIDGDWVKAKGTTLGADNGIGVAMGLAILDSTNIPHPALELLCTLDEETGLTGAIQLGSNLLDSQILINLDSEEDGHFTIGCAGGINTNGHYNYDSDYVPENTIAYELVVKGLKGGHSGIEIHDGRANAIKLMTRLIKNLMHEYNINLSSFNSGSKHNAIPREAFATIVVPAVVEKYFVEFIDTFQKTILAEWKTKEPNISISATVTEMPKRVMTEDFQTRLINSFYAMPHGVIRMSPDIQGLVQTSTNFAIVETKDDEVLVVTSQRSSVESEKADIASMVKSTLELGGARVKLGDGYPAWSPDINSPILNIAKKVFKNLWGKEPVIEAIHAGLECGLIGEKYPQMDMLSFGPNLVDVHSPDEKVQISTVDKAWKLLLAILKNIPVK